MSDHHHEVCWKEKDDSLTDDAHAECALQRKRITAALDLIHEIPGSVHVAVEGLRNLRYKIGKVYDPGPSLLESFGFEDEE